MLTKRTCCRLCNSENLDIVYEMPKCPPVDNYRFSTEPDASLPAFPMDLYMCASCGHVQLLDVVDPNILFGNYIYTSSSSPDLDRHFSGYAEKVIDFAQLSRESLVIDIGSNDGLLLSKFQKHGIRVYGVDPASMAVSSAAEKGIPTILSFLNRDVVSQLKSHCGLADVVCANNVFSHADNLQFFAECALALLKPNGIFIFEVSYLRDLVERRIVDYIYHEHLAHHSVRPLREFFERFQMKILNVERIQTKGGSIRCYVASQASHWAESDTVRSLIEDEIATGLYLKKTYVNLKEQINILGEKVRLTLEEEISKGRVVASYGASATTTVLNAILGIDEYISFIIDDNPSRQGRVSPGYKRPVVSREVLAARNFPVVFISAWRFADLIIMRNQDFLEAGGVFIVPLPVFKIISKDRGDLG